MSADRAYRARPEPGARRAPPRPRPGRAAGFIRVQRRNGVHGAKLTRNGALREGLRSIRATMPRSAAAAIFDRGLINRRLDRAWARRRRRRAGGLPARPGGRRTSANGCRWSNAASPSPPISARPALMARPRSRPAARSIALSGSPRPRRAWEPALFCRLSATSSACRGGWPPRPRRLAARAADRERSAGRAGPDAAAR